jgi:hypothetical protein
MVCPANTDAYQPSLRDWRSTALQFPTLKRGARVIRSLRDGPHPTGWIDPFAVVLRSTPEDGG